MRQLWWANRLFFSLIVIFILLASAGLAVWEHGEAILLFSGHRSPFWNEFFRVANTFGEEPAFVLAFLFLLFVGYRYAAGVPLLAGAATLLAFGAKSLFGRPRPMAYFREVDRWHEVVPVEGVAVHSGLNSFPSGHTLAAFALFTYLALVVPRKQGTALLFFLLALSGGLARIYLVQHFLEDVLAGAVLGVLLGLAAYLLLRPTAGRKSWWDGSLGQWNLSAFKSKA